MSENLYRVPKLHRSYRYCEGANPAKQSHVVGPVFGQVYPAERTPQGIVIDLRGPGVAHFHDHHPDAETL